MQIKEVKNKSEHFVWRKTEEKNRVNVKKVVMKHNFYDYDSSGPRPPIPGEETATNRKVLIYYYEKIDFINKFE